MYNVTFTTATPKGINAKAHRKENNFQGQYTIIDGDTMKEILVCRTYGTASTNYACLWVYGDSHKAGSGKAGGFGYHRISAAVQEAINTAGYILSNEDGKQASISGVGESAIKEALIAIAKYAGYSNVYLFEAHA